MKPDQQALVRALNDALRKDHRNGRIFITSGVVSLGPNFVALAVSAVARFTEFDEGNDPWGEHDFGAITVLGAKVFWKIDYYDLTLTAGAEDPSDSQTCVRVLTVMLSDEY